VHLWKKTLDLGWSLLMAGVHDDRAWSRQAFMQQLEDVRKEVMGALLEHVSRARPAPYPAEQALPLDDTAIHDVLLQIMSKWRTQAPEQVKTKVETRKEEKEELLETVIITPAKTGAQAPPGVTSKEANLEELDKKKPRKSEEEFVAETVILTVKGKDK
jgi:hypothetical protein